MSDFRELSALTGEEGSRSKHERLHRTSLPDSPGEATTCEVITSTKKKELLGQTGGEFELSLLLTQAEALSYALRLAKVAGENES